MEWIKEKWQLVPRAMSWTHDLILRWRGDLFCLSLIGALIIFFLLPFQEELGIYFWLAQFTIVPTTVLTFLVTLILVILDGNRIERELQAWLTKEKERKVRKP